MIDSFENKNHSFSVAHEFCFSCTGRGPESAHCASCMMYLNYYVASDTPVISLPNPFPQSALYQKPLGELMMRGCSMTSSEVTSERWTSGVSRSWRLSEHHHFVTRACRTQEFIFHGGVCMRILLDLVHATIALDCPDDKPSVTFSPLY